MSKYTVIDNRTKETLCRFQSEFQFRIDECLDLLALGPKRIIGVTYYLPLDPIQDNEDNVKVVTLIVTEV